SRGLRFQPTSFSGASITTSTEAGGPAATTRSTRSGTSTLRPAESMTSRAEAPVSRQPSNAAMAAAAFHASAACREIGPAPLSSSSLFPANQLSDCAKLSTGRRPRMCFNGAVEIDNALADRGEGGASAPAAAGLGGNSGLTQRMIDFLDQQPCPA